MVIYFMQCSHTVDKCNFSVAKLMLKITKQS